MHESAIYIDDIYIHTYAHTYIHTHIHTYVYIYIHTYIHRPPTWGYLFVYLVIYPSTVCLSICLSVYLHSPTHLPSAVCICEHMVLHTSVTRSPCLYKLCICFTYGWLLVEVYSHGSGERPSKPWDAVEMFALYIPLPVIRHRTCLL